MPLTERHLIATQGHGDTIDITELVAAAITASGLSAGIALVFVPGATAAVTTLEYESGLLADIQAALEKLAAEQADYRHHQRWGDHNGAAHIKAALIGPSLSLPFEQGRLLLGDWQQIALIDFDERPRQREFLIKLIEA